MRRDLNTCSRQSAMHHGVRVRVFFRWSTEHHSRNDSSSSSTSWSHDVHVFSRIRTRYFSEGSVQQYPPSYSFRIRVVVRSDIKRLFFPWKTKGKKARVARAPHDYIVFTGPTIRTSYSFLFCFFDLGFTRACWRSFGITRYLPQPPIVFASPSIDKHGSQLSTAGIRQQTAAAPTSEQQHSKSTRVHIIPGKCVANPASPRAPLASQRLRK